MTYRTILLDLDHTLLDSDTSEAMAFSATLASAGIDVSETHFPIYDRINKGLWAAVERGEASPNEVKLRRWELFALEAALDVDADELASSFVEGLGQHGELYEGARELLEVMAAQTTLGLVTNGLSSVQRARIARLELSVYFSAIAISGELGVSKPDTAFLDVVFHDLDQPDRATAVIVGDSLTSDMAAGHNYGISTCWYNPHGRASGDPSPTYVATSFDDVRVALLGAR